jgi:kynurenine formamidase
MEIRCLPTIEDQLKLPGGFSSEGRTEMSAIEFRGLAVTAMALLISGSAFAEDLSLWKVYDDSLKTAKYIDLTHAFEPVQPVWPGFANAKFKPSVAGQDIEGYVGVGEEFTYEKHGFVATAYELTTDQYGTQLDPPSHWNPLGATISDLPATYAIRPLVVIDISGKVAADEGYHLQVSDIEEWEAEHGRIPEGSVVFVRSDWYKKWADTARFNQKPFPGVSLDALKFLHLEREILFHGHEPLDTDTTPTLEGEHWLLHNDFVQAEGVANLDKVPEAGALVTIGFAKPLGGSGGLARYVAIAPSDWPEGVSVVEQPGVPLARQAAPLKRDANGVFRPTP